MDVIVRLRHPRSGDSQGQKTFLAPSVDKQTRDYDTEFSNHHPSVSTLRPKGLSRRKMKWWAICLNLPVDVLVRLPHPRSGDNQGQETFSAPSADKPTRNYDRECSNHHSSLSTISPKGWSRSKMKCWAIHTNLPVDVIVRLPHPRRGDSQGKKKFLAPFRDKLIRDYDIEFSNQHPSVSTLRLNGLSRSKMIWWAVSTNLPADVKVRLPHPSSGDSQGQEMFLAPSADKPTGNYDTEFSNHHASLSTQRPKGLSHIQMKWLAISSNLPVDVIVRLPHPRYGDSQGEETFLVPPADEQTRN